MRALILLGNARNQKVMSGIRAARAMTSANPTTGSHKDAGFVALSPGRRLDVSQIKAAEFVL